ncbi:MAG: hypothetical protein HPY75_12885 [Actinobacteria bacterium]|nr:hypothetical protein [Actinomycetota bacterium]
MEIKRKVIISIIVISSLTILALLLPIMLKGGSSDALATEIKQNAFETARDIKSYKIEVEIRNTKQETPGCDRVDKSTIWVKGPDKIRIDNEITGLEAIGIPPTKSTIIQNGRCIYSTDSESISIYDNCPPFDYFYGELDCAYVMANELNTLIDANLVNVAGDEMVRGKDAYRLEIMHDADNAITRPDLPDREIRWVEKSTSVCLKKETYKDGKLVNTLEVTDYEINNEIPDSIFSPELEGKACRERRDGGYRDLDPQEAPETCGFTPVFPSYIPETYKMDSTGWRDPRASDLPTNLPPNYAPLWYKPFYITLRNSMSEISICEAKKLDKDLPDSESLTVNPDGELNVIEIALSGGRTGYYVPEKRTLYFFSKDIKIRIRADIPVGELVKIAESMLL